MKDSVRARLGYLLSLFADLYVVAHVVQTGLPTVLESFGELGAEMLQSLLFRLVGHEGFLEVFDVLDAAHLRYAGVHHHHEEDDEELAVLPQDAKGLLTQFLEPAFRSSLRLRNSRSLAPLSHEDLVENFRPKTIGPKNY